MSDKTDAEMLVNEMETSAKIAQVFSAMMFAFIVVYLVFSNSTKVSLIQQASQEKRLAVCCTISTAVAAISCFLNVFQITEVDNLVIPNRSDSEYTLDLARPVEWILTCPLLQLAIVLMGGSKIPEYRRLLMPGFSASIIATGVVSIYLPQPWGWLCGAFGTILFFVMAYFNRQQVIEHSNGTEGLLNGDSEFRKATIILLMTWTPFVPWYALSPEGFNVIDNILAIQIGWMVLNLVAKSSLLFFFQRAKDNYVARLKVNRLMKGAQGGATSDTDEENQSKIVEASLGPCVSETMTFLGLADKSERFLRLLKDANIKSLDDVALLSPEDCKEKKLPWDLINALQKRYRIWTLEVADDAEDGIERGESYYLRTKAKNAALNQQLQEGQAMPVGIQLPSPLGADNRTGPPMDISFTPSGMPLRQDMMGPAINENGTQVILEKLQGVEDIIERLFTLEGRVEKGFENMEKSIQSVDQQVVVSCDMNAQKIDKGLQAITRDLGKSTGECQQAITSGLQTVSKSLERSEVELQEKIAMILNNEDKRLQCIADGIQTRLVEVGQNLSEHTVAISRNSQTTLSDVGHSVDRALEEIRHVLTSNKTNVLQDLENMIEKMTQTVVTDAKSNALNLIAKVSFVEEARLKSCAELESQLKKCMHEGMQSASNNQGDDALQRILEELRQLQDGRGRYQEEWNQDFTRSLKEVNEIVERHVQVAVGVLSNTLRAQLDDIENIHKETRSKMKDNLNENEKLMAKLEYNLQKDLNDQKHSHQGLMNKMEHETQGLINKLEHELKKDINEQKQLSNSVLEQAAAAQLHSKECCGMMAELSDRMAPTTSTKQVMAELSDRMTLAPTMSPPHSERGMPQQINGMLSPLHASASTSSMQRPQTAGPTRNAGSSGLAPRTSLGSEGGGPDAAACRSQFD